MILEQVQPATVVVGLDNTGGGDGGDIRSPIIPDITSGNVGGGPPGGGNPGGVIIRN